MPEVSNSQYKDFVREYTALTSENAIPEEHYQEIFTNFVISCFATRNKRVINAFIHTMYSSDRNGVKIKLVGLLDYLRKNDSEKFNLLSVDLKAVLNLDPTSMGAIINEMLNYQIEG